MKSGAIADAIKILTDLGITKKRAISLVTAMLDDRVAYQDFINAMNVAMSSGYCMCGMFSLDDREKYGEYNLCEYCREPNRSAILLVPTVQVITDKIEMIRPGQFWYHVIPLTDAESTNEAILRLLTNIEHKLEHGFPPIRIINAMGSDALAQAAFQTAAQWLTEEKDLVNQGLVKFSNMRVGIPANTPITKVGDETLNLLLGLDD